jgi:catechol 2,3-dioxygenase-like lactoylglutathione lyase family enzyme
VSTTPSLISQLQLVVVPSSDQDRSLAFYEALGFERRNDIPFGEGHRWVEVYPPGGTAGIALVTPHADDPRGVQTGIILNTDDIAATHAHLRASDVDVDPEIARAAQLP